MPITVTSTPESLASIAALRPAPPLPITRTFEILVVCLILLIVCIFIFLKCVTNVLQI